MIIPVVAAVLRNEQGRLLLARRPEGKHLAGTWEFPGGKLEPDELPEHGLSRELAEELGIVVHESRPLLTLTHHYDDRSVRLMLREVDAWQGTPVGLEDQALQWVSLSDARRLPMPAADRPIIKALELDPLLLISPRADESEYRPDDLSSLTSLFEPGNGFVCIQLGALDEGPAQDLANACRRLANQYAAAWVVEGSTQLAERINADGVCLGVDQLRCLEQRPLSTDRTVIARCRTAADLALAGRIGLDLALVGPVLGDAGGAPPLGWKGLADLVGESTLPVYAYGGLIPEDLPAARQAGAFGVAGDLSLN